MVVNNAGIARDRMLVNLTEDDWDQVMQVHLKSTFLVTQRAARHWRERTKSGETGETVDARVVNTVSSVGLYGHVGQSNTAPPRRRSPRSRSRRPWSSAATAPR